LEDTCPFCGGRGLFVQGEVAVRCDCTRQGRVALPPRLSAYRFENFRLGYYPKDIQDPARGLSYFELARLALEAARQFAREFGTGPYTDGLLFTGTVGSGKTMLAGAIANDLIARGVRISFLVVPEWLDALRDSYNLPKESRESFRDLVAEAREAPLLILDDLGAHNYTEWTLNSLYTVVNYRFNHLLPLVVTTNLDVGEWAGRLGQRTTSRLIQMCRPCQLLVKKDIREVLRGEQAGRQKRKPPERLSEEV